MYSKATYANDGNTFTQSSTYYGHEHWWQVDLGRNFWISRIEILFLKADRYKNLSIYTRGMEIDDWDLCYLKVQHKRTRLIRTTCVNNERNDTYFLPRTRFVRIMVHDTEKEIVLELAEVKIYGNETRGNVHLLFLSRRYNKVNFNNTYIASHCLQT